MLKAVKVMNKNNVHAFCVKRNLYNEGTIDEYKDMLNSCKNVKTDDDAIKIGINIWEHTDKETLHEGYNLKLLLTGVLNECMVTIVEDDGE